MPLAGFGATTRPGEIPHAFVSRDQIRDRILRRPSDLAFDAVYQKLLPIMMSAMGH
jgi:hypothetical protein